MAETDPKLKIEQLTAKNYDQASRIMELEFYLSCIQITGSTVYVDHNRIQHMACFINTFNNPPGLGASKYCKDTE